MRQNEKLSLSIFTNEGTSLMVQWLRLHAPNAGGLGSIPGQETRSLMPQLRPRMLQLKILHATTKTQHSHNNNKIIIIIIIIITMRNLRHRKVKQISQVHSYLMEKSGLNAWD